MVFKSEYSYQIESFLHKRFSHCHKEGEWFELDINNELFFLNECEQIEKNYYFFKKL